MFGLRHDANDVRLTRDLRACWRIGVSGDLGNGIPLPKMVPLARSVMPNLPQWCHILEHLGYPRSYYEIPIPYPD